MKDSELFSALDSVKADAAFRQRLKHNLAYPPKKRWLPSVAIATACLLVAAGVIYHLAPTAPEFAITGRELEGKTSYISVVYIDGYGYYYSDWHNECSDRFARGSKLGEITLDLKGLLYTGIPPSFSGTLDWGTEIYAVAGFKPEYAVLAVNGQHQMILYRGGRVLAKAESISITVKEIVAMVAHSPTISAVELLDEENGGIIRLSMAPELLALLDQEFISQPLANYGPVHGPRIPLNLVCQGGEILHLQVFPAMGAAAFFRGLVALPPNLVEAFTAFAAEGAQYQSIASLLPDAEAKPAHLRYSDEQTGKETVAAENSQAWWPLWDRLRYWRLEELTGTKADKTPLIALEFGPSEQDSAILRFYTDQTGTLLEYGDKLYRLVRNSYRVEEEIKAIFRDY